MALTDAELDALAARVKAHADRYWTHAERYWSGSTTPPPTPPYVPHSSTGLFTPGATQDGGAPITAVQGHIPNNVLTLPASPEPEPEPWRPNFGDPEWFEYQVRSRDRKPPFDRIPNLADGPKSVYITVGMELSMERRTTRFANQAQPYLFALNDKGKMAVATKGSDAGPRLFPYSNHIHTSPYHIWVYADSGVIDSPDSDAGFSHSPLPASPILKPRSTRITKSKSPRKKQRKHKQPRMA